MIKITHKFETIDGQEFERADSKDFETLPNRFLQRIEKELGSNKQNILDSLEDGLNKYNQGEYEDALKCFNNVTDTYPSLIIELEPFIDICNRVVKTIKSGKDLLYEAYKKDMMKWHSRSFLYKLLHRKEKPIFQFGLLESVLVRCKYCGHYTSYKHPYDGFECMHKVKSFLSNSCKICERSYSAPSTDWDNIDGQAYIYYRHSVSEEVFYDEFEKKYNLPKIMALQ